MLYVSTRNHIDSFTAYRTLHEDCAPDGGMFVPMRFPKFSQAELDQLKKSSFGDTVAYILNLFFSADLSGWDIDSCAGRRPFRLVNMSHKLIIAELWHNHESDYAYLETGIYKKLCVGESFDRVPTPWAKIAIRIAVLWGIWGEITALETAPVDIAVTTGDFSVPISVWYAKKMGLPIGRIICACQDNGMLWDLVHRGEMNTAASADAFPVCVEQLIYDTLGLNETQRFLNACQKRRSFRLDETQLTKLSTSLYASVIGSQRIDSLISSIFRSCGYIADPAMAVSFGGLQNYRAQTGLSQKTVLLGEQSAAHHKDRICGLLNISKEELRNTVNNT